MVRKIYKANFLEGCDNFVCRTPFIRRIRRVLEPGKVDNGYPKRIIRLDVLSKDKTLIQYKTNDNTAHLSKRRQPSPASRYSAPYPRIHCGDKVMCSTRADGDGGKHG